MEMAIGFENGENGKIGHYAKAIGFAKGWVSLKN